MNPIKHGAIIMDGNGRWGIKNKNSRNAGHKAGLYTVEVIIKECLVQNIKYLTLYTFSTENWKRPKEEINYLFDLLNSFLTNKINELKKKEIKVKFIGEIKKLPNNLKKIIKSSEKITSNNKLLQINVALNYGSKNEIVKSLKSINKKKISINETNITKNLFTKNIQDPDILIRTGNTKRLSNFMLWQLAYTEIFFEKKLWPDFKGNDFKKILKRFRSIKRNFGSI
jgi:undecaprenyl diphosphate synthase